MQLGDREKNSIVISLILNLVFVLIFIMLGFFHTYGKYEKIEGQKVQLKTILDETSKVEKQGISFKDFNGLKSKVKYTKTEFLDSILSEMKPSFYNDNFINEGEGKFEIYLKDKERFFFANDELLAFSEEELELLDDDVEEKVRKEKTRKEKIISILPSYNPGLKPVDENLLTDFKFVNYVESIIRTFDLQYDGDIGIKTIIPYEKEDTKSSKSKKAASTNAKIFYIPATLSVVGNKENIINFLHYIGNVGNIEIIDGDFNILTDNFLEKRRKIILTGDFNKLFGNGSRYSEGFEESDPVKDYNIYNNQIIELISIRMDEYPVAYYLEGNRDKEKTLIEFLKEDQKNHKFGVTVNLRFYIMGIPNYKMIEYIKNFFTRYDETNKKIVAKISEFNKSKDIREDGDLILLNDLFKKSNDYLNSISGDIKKFQSTLSKGNGIDDLYEKILEYSDILENIISVLGLDEEELEENILSNEKPKDK